jgi:hypothetical protein
MDKQIITELQKKLPDWAVKPHPTKTGMTAINPMAVIDQLNDAFGIGQWNFKTDYLACNPWVQKTKNGERNMFMSAVKGTLIVSKENIHIEQYGGSSNDDMGDALKGGATDALTKCASYLGVGASVYKGQGNIDAPIVISTEEAFTLLREASTLDELKNIFVKLPKSLQSDTEVVALKDELKTKLA